MEPKLTVKTVRQVVNYHAETIGKNKLGNIVLRKGFFYRNGYSAEKFADTITARLIAQGVTNFVVLDKGEVWKAFRGNATTAQGSHWYVVLGEKV